MWREKVRERNSERWEEEWREKNKTEGEWTRVQPKKLPKLRWDIRQSEYSTRSRKVSTFFVTEFPEEYGAKDLYNVFSEFGEVDEVIIPSKRDVRGKKYGFVRFFDVKEVELLATKLDNIFLGMKKIHVNVPKHERGVSRKSEGLFRAGGGGGGGVVD
ncbi:polyadenylate-binding protein, cytoplasmic and nuclear-like [Vicia villosa]|uniref:polyadenylate-binding protein, cytoplasmic and nuclear-like n=1 Tax=Vicia villosa TaxID=3911 RepID=UPI00273A8434|nr:polyadenylate-binding protein, cytoplasmic and nuclear-like [Vicia villosa]XP_058740913.1 polyadenylate-binding protein, cytoplasmic and nuclear-like [Vicia villosa]